MIDKGVCDKGFIWHSSKCECECDKSYDFGEYLGYENCKSRKRLVDKLVEECTENVKEEEIAKITLTENCTNAVLACCTLRYFQQSLQSTLELVLILFTTNTWIIIKKTAPRYDYVYQETNY